MIQHGSEIALRLMLLSLTSSASCRELSPHLFAKMASVLHVDLSQNRNLTPDTRQKLKSAWTIASQYNTGECLQKISSNVAIYICMAG